MKKPLRSSSKINISNKVLIRKSFRLQLKYRLNSVYLALKSMGLNLDHDPSLLYTNCDNDPSHSRKEREVRRSVAKFYQTRTALKFRKAEFRGSCLTISHFVPNITLFLTLFSKSFKKSIP
jgi:hypothetical protein